MSTLPHNLSSDTASGRGKCLPRHLPRGGGQEITRWGIGRCQACRGWKCSPWLPAAAGGRGTVARTLRWVPAAAVAAGRGRACPPAPGAAWCGWGSSSLWMGARGGGGKCFPRLPGAADTPTVLAGVPSGRGQRSPQPPEAAGCGARGCSPYPVSADASGWVRVGAVKGFSPTGLGFSPFLVLWPERKSFSLVLLVFVFLSAGESLGCRVLSNPGWDFEKTGSTPLCFLKSCGLQLAHIPLAITRVSLLWALVLFTGIRVRST